jgi:hypothetical protein
MHPFFSWTHHTARNNSPLIPLVNLPVLQLKLPIQRHHFLSTFHIPSATARRKRMRMLLSLALPILALPFITVHVSAHALRLDARATTNGDVQILARAPPAGTGDSPPGSPATTAGNDDAQPHEHVLYAGLGLLRAGIWMYYVPDASYKEKAKRKWLQKLFILLTDSKYREQLDYGSRPQESRLVRSLIYHAMIFNTAIMEAAQRYSAGAFHSATGSGHLQATGQSQTHQPVLNVWDVLSSYHDEIGLERKGEHLQSLLSILTSPELPQSGDGKAEQALLHSLTVKAAEFNNRLHGMYTYYHKVQITSFDARTQELQV